MMIYSKHSHNSHIYIYRYRYIEMYISFLGIENGRSSKDLIQASCASLTGEKRTTSNNQLNDT